MRLIDADALMNDFRAYMAKRRDRERCASEENCKTCVPGCLWRKKIFAASTIDPETLRPRAQWIAYWGVSDWAECSNCHEASKISVVEHKEFCPACGAKMVGKVRNDL